MCQVICAHALKITYLPTCLYACVFSKQVNQKFSELKHIGMVTKVHRQDKLYAHSSKTEQASEITMPLDLYHCTTQTW